MHFHQSPYKYLHSLDNINHYHSADDKKVIVPIMKCIAKSISILLFIFGNKLSALRTLLT